MYTLDDLNSDLGEQIAALKNSKNDVETAQIITKSKAMAELSRTVVDSYKVKASVIGLLKNDASPDHLKNMIRSSGLAPELSEMQAIPSNSRKLEIE